MKAVDCYIYPDGKIRNLKSGKFVNGVIGGGYKRIKYNGKLKAIHVLVCEKYLGTKPDKHVCNHIDGDKFNNHILNLEYVTHRENNLHAVRTGLVTFKYGEAHKNSKVNNTQVQQIRKERPYSTLKQLSIKYGLSVESIRDIVNFKTWKQI